MTRVKPLQIVESEKTPQAVAKKLATRVLAPKRARVDVRAEVKRELAVLGSPTASKKLHSAFAATPDELAAAANAAKARRGR